MKTHRLKLINGPAPAPAGRAPKFWNVISGDDGSSAEITMYGDVVTAQPVDWWTGLPEPGMFITPEGFLEDLAAVRDRENITIRLNSGGGDLYTGIAIHDALKGLKGHKTVVIEGIAASAASVIACAGDDVQLHRGSTIMIHGVKGLYRDYMAIADLKQAIKQIDAAEQAVAEIYHAKTGIETDTLRSMMTRETWMIGQDAIDKGFANTLLDDDGPEMTLSADRKVLLVAGIRHDASYFQRIPGGIPVNYPEVPAGTPAGTYNNTPVNAGGKQKEVKPMTEQEIRAQYPEIVASIEAAARSAAITDERARLQAIDAIEAQIGDRDLVAAAKYGDKACTAAELALAAMQKQAAQGAAFLGKLGSDAQNSGADGVHGNPNGGNADEGHDDEAELAGIINAYKNITGGTRA